MSLFTQDEIVIRTGARVLRMVALTEPIYGVAVILEGIFNGVGDTMHTFAFNVVGMWGVRILGTYIFVIRLGQDLTSAWACMIAHNIALGRNAHGAIPARPLESVGRKLTILTKLFPVAVRLNVTNCM